MYKRMKSITECYSSTPLNAILNYNGQLCTYKDYLKTFGLFEIEEKIDEIQKIRKLCLINPPQKTYFNKMKISLLLKKLKGYLNVE